MNQQVLEALENVSQIVEEIEVEKEVEVEEDDSIQAVKKPRTQKQIDAFKGVCAKRTLAREARVIKRDGNSFAAKFNGLNNDQKEQLWNCIIYGSFGSIPPV